MYFLPLRSTNIESRPLILFVSLGDPTHSSTPPKIALQAIYSDVHLGRAIPAPFISTSRRLLPCHDNSDITAASHVRCRKMENLGSVVLRTVHYCAI